jgi:hypothetical protein
MKTSIKNKINFATWLCAPFTLASFLVSVQSHAQQRDLHFGFEAASSTRKYTVHSDLATLKNKFLVQQGRTYALIFGSSLAKGRFSFGTFGSDKKDQTPIHSSSIELALNISPIQLFIKQDRAIEPYLVASVETTKVKSSGLYVPPPDLPAPSAAATPSTCSCTCTSPAQSSPSTKQDPSPVPYVGNYGTTRIILGAGLNVHLTKGPFFLNLFAEAKYGISAGTTYSTQALSYTYTLNQVTYTTGASIGITKDRSHGRLRKHRFR